MRWGLMVICVLLLFVWGGTRIFEDIEFNRNISGYLKRAADANSVDLAIQNMTIAVNNAQAEGLTDGYNTSPSEDVGFWFKNLTASLNNLKTVKPDASALEQTNILIKLRETLLDHSGNGESVTSPPGISLFPHNTLFAAWGWLSVIAAMVFGGFLGRQIVSDE